MPEDQTSQVIKTCTRCKEALPEAAFYRNGPIRRDSTCGACRNVLRRIRGRREKRQTPEERRERWLRDTYKITVAQYEALLEAQGGVCAICQTQPMTGKPLVIDHCHARGVVRALLCNLCNLQIGVYERTRHVAVEYLAKYANGNPLLISEERAGRTRNAAGSAKEHDMTDTKTPAEGHCERCTQTRPLIPRPYTWPDTGHTETAMLCPPCHDTTATWSANRLEEELFLAMGGGS